MKNIGILLLASTLTLAGCFGSKKTAEAQPEPIKLESAESPAKMTAAPVKKETIDKEKNQQPDFEKKNQEIIASLPDDVVLMLEKTSCYGRCPTFVAKVYKNGTVEYAGKNWVDNVGSFKGQMKADEVTRLLNLANEIKFFELNYRYDSGVTDLPSVICYVNNNGKKHRVTARQSQPQEFTKFAEQLNNAFNSITLTKAE